MLRNKLVRSDGSVIDSSVILSCEYTEEVNSATNLTVGNATAAELRVEMLSSASISQGDVFTYYVIEDGVETQIGVFTADRPTVATKSSIRFTAYDNIAKTEVNFSEVLREARGSFPILLGDLVSIVCDYCGVPLATTNFPNAKLSVSAFYADDITCRQILMWAGAIAGRFVCANADGEIEFRWYEDSYSVMVSPSKISGVSVYDDGDGNVSLSSPDIEVIDDGEGNVELYSEKLSVVTTETGVSITSSENSMPYLLDSLSYEKYSTEPIQRVQIKHADDDVGVIYPSSATGNCFTISGNMLLGAMQTAEINTVASYLYQQLRNMTYVPFSATLPKTLQIRAGQNIQVQDSDGNKFSSFVMSVSVAPGGTTIQSTGDPSYESNVAVASQKYTNLTGKMLRVEKSVEGLKVAASDLAGKASQLQLDIDKIETRVEDAEGNYSSLRQTVDEIASRVEGEDGNYSDLKQDVDGIESRVGTVEGDYSLMKQTVEGLTSRVENAEGSYSQLEQDVGGFTLTFQTVSDDIKAVNDDLQNKYNERVSYIRFEDGNIILGKTDSEIMLIQKNDRISFVRNVEGFPEVAWFSNDVLHVTEGQFTVQLGIGNFGFRPGANGNLSFKKVVT